MLTLTVTRLTRYLQKTEITDELRLVCHIICSESMIFLTVCFICPLIRTFPWEINNDQAQLQGSCSEILPHFFSYPNFILLLIYMFFIKCSYRVDTDK